MSGPLFSMGKLVLMVGIFLSIIGLLMLFAGKFFNLGRLPGDLFIQRGSFSFYFPIVSSILLSIILTLVLNLFFRR